MRKKGKIAALLLILFLLLFFTLDLFLGRLFVPRNYSEFRIRHPWYHHGLMKNVSTLAAWGPIIYPFYTNNLAFRDLSVRNVALKSDNKRILILGDSHSEGVGVDYRYSYAGRLQLLAADRQVDILNASAVSYSPRIHYLKADMLLNQVGLEVDEVWVVIDLSDLQNEIAYAGFEPSNPGVIYNFLSPVFRYFKNRSLTAFSFQRIMDNRAYENMKETLLGLQDQQRQLPTRNSIELYREFFRHFDDQTLLRDPGFHGVSEWIYDASLRELADQGLDLGMSHMSLLKEMCDKKGISMRLSVHPWQTQVLKGDTTDYYVERWRSFCEEKDIHFMNLYPLFITHENPLWVAKTCYIEGDNHWNEMGHARVAAYLSKYID